MDSQFQRLKNETIGCFYVTSSICFNKENGHFVTQQVAGGQSYMVEHNVIAAILCPQMMYVKTTIWAFSN